MPNWNNLEIKKWNSLEGIGPEGGDNGGKVMFEGVQEDLIKEENSYTGKFLKERFH